MFGFLRNILRRPGDASAVQQQSPPEMDYAQPSVPPPAPPAARSTPHRQNGGRNAQGFQPAPAGYQPGPTGYQTAPAGYQPHQNGGPQRPTHQNGSGKGVEVPLQKILESLSLELQPRVRNPNVGGATISIPLEKVLSQLSRGAVKLTFGELRQAAPGVFSSETDRDRVMVQLPLNEILAQLNPALIARRRVQKQIEVPEDISSPFESPDQSGLTFSANPAQQTRQTAPTPPAANPYQANPFTPAQNPFQPAQNPFQPAQNQFQPPPRQFQPPPNQFQPPPNQFQPPQKPFTPPQNPYPPAQKPIQPPAPPQFQDIPNPFQVPGRPPVPPAPLGIPAGRNTITSTPTPQPPASEPLISPQIAAASRALRDFENKAPNSIAPSPLTPEPAHSGETIAVTLNAIAESWPENIHKEVAQLNLMDAKVHLPVEAVAQGLRQGRIAVSWKAVRSWIKGPGLSFTSPQDSTMLELPLKVVAPLFMARQRDGQREAQKVKIDQDIPNLFFGFPQPDSANATATPATPAPAPSPAAHSPAAPAHGGVTKPKDTNYYAWEDASQSLQAPQQQPAVKRNSPGTKFITRYATPNEVVSRAAALEGVAGSLIALPDGLMVASQLSPDLNGDTLAAFLPQIFAKVNQCTKELRMGELNNLNFTVGNVPWKIFRVNAIFFAAFGRAGEPLPTGQLAALAAELDHKGK
jgi:predicted regulator of Ras-like GTPase activity (Roadblock/LC7/MglB family)